MRQIQKQSFQKETENRQQPVKALWKSSKYDSIESKVKEELQVGIYFIIIISHFNVLVVFLVFSKDIQ